MLDVPRILPCLPGARLTEVIGANKYLGSVAVKLGPIKLAFDGQAELVRRDDVAHIAYLQGSGVDPKGRGAVQSEFSFALTPRNGGTDVIVTTQLQLSGSVAQYGRGSGMIAEVASHILAQFERNLADMTSGSQRTPEPAVQAASFTNRPTVSAAASDPGIGIPPITSTAEVQTMLYQAQAVLGQAQSVLALTQEALLQFQTVSARPNPAKSKPPQELDMLSIGLKALWSQIKYAVNKTFRWRRR